MDHEHDNVDNVSARRRAIFDRVRAKFAATGVRIDADPRFVDLVEQWIGGRIAIGDVARGYGELRRSSRTKPVEAAPPADNEPARMSEGDLMAELEWVIGVYDPEKGANPS